MTSGKTDLLCINTIRTLAIDAIQKAKSGHPGTPMGMAPVAYGLWQQRLNFDPADPIWPNRDRFVLSAGHASMLLYALLHLTRTQAVDADYQPLGRPSVTLDDIKAFRQLDSACPGHPEYHLTSGVEATTGPLGQGVAMSVGLAIAERWLGAYFNRPGLEIVDWRTYALCGDGCMMEGISGEAASLAGHLRLEKLCWIYDSNRVTIEGHTEIAFTEDVATRFLGYGWNVLHVRDANEEKEVLGAFDLAARERGRPTLIIIESHIGYGAPHKQDTARSAWRAAGRGRSQGRPSGSTAGPKMRSSWCRTASTSISPTASASAAPPGTRHGATCSPATATAIPSSPHSSRRCRRASCPRAGTRQSRHSQPIRKASPAAILGPGRERDCAAPAVADRRRRRPGALHQDAADLRRCRRLPAGQSPRPQPAFRRPRARDGRGTERHGTGKLRPFGSGFLIFSDYMRNPIRLSAIMQLPVLYIFTHDSIGVGEDGPTHQPVEQLAGLRAVPGLITLRPCDANEVAESWRTVLRLKHQPACLILSRQALPTLDRGRFASAAGVARGAYVLADLGGAPPKVILIGTGSEVSLCISAAEQLAAEGIPARVVSMPSWELFEQQDEAYQEQVLPEAIVARVAVEQAATLGWARYVGRRGAIVGMHTFGASAPLKGLLTKFGFTPEHVVKAAREQVARHTT